MFSHIMIGSNDIESSKKFYDAVLAAFGYAAGKIDRKGRCVYRTKTGLFMVTKPLNGESASGANGGTIGFSASNEDEVEAWHKAGLANGGVAVEDPPGYREMPTGRLYLAYLLDPAGNKLCALYRPSS